MRRNLALSAWPANMAVPPSAPFLAGIGRKRVLEMMEGVTFSYTRGNVTVYPRALNTLLIDAGAHPTEIKKGPGGAVTTSSLIAAAATVEFILVLTAVVVVVVVVGSAIVEGSEEEEDDGDGGGESSGANNASGSYYDPDGGLDGDRLW